MARRNAFYAQSGGVSGVINASACGMLQTARRHPDLIAKVYAGHNGILGALTEDLIDTSIESEAAIAALEHTPGAAFGSCRYKLGPIQQHQTQYERLVEVFRAHDIAFFFYNGGGDSQDTAHKISQISQDLGYPIVCVGIPKTVDNDLAVTDNAPGFGSTAKYLATSLREAAFDLAAMSATSTKVFALEVMGRHAGWTTAACALAAEQEGDAPHILLLPEVPFNEHRFLAKVDEALKRYGHCVVAVAEGVIRTCVTVSATPAPRRLWTFTTSRAGRRFTDQARRRSGSAASRLSPRSRLRHVASVRWLFASSGILLSGRKKRSLAATSRRPSERYQRAGFLPVPEECRWRQPGCSRPCPGRTADLGSRRATQDNPQHWQHAWTTSRGCW
jgi:6-phosphofructokinase